MFVKTKNINTYNDMPKKIYKEKSFTNTFNFKSKYKLKIIINNEKKLTIQNITFYYLYQKY